VRSLPGCTEVEKAGVESGLALNNFFGNRRIGGIGRLCGLVVARIIFCRRERIGRLNVSIFFTPSRDNLANGNQQRWNNQQAFHRSPFPNIRSAKYS
jgi:hypothetical protein